MCRNSNFSPSPFPTPHSWKHKTFPQHLTCPGPSTAQAGIANSRCLCSATRPPGLLRFLFWVWEGDGLDPGYLWSSSIAAPPGYPLGRLRWASRWLRRSVSPAPGPLGRPGPGRGCVRVRLPHPPRGRNKGWGAAEHTGGGSAIRPSPPELATSAARDGAAGCGPRAAGGRRGRARGPGPRGRRAGGRRGAGSGRACVRARVRVRGRPALGVTRATKRGSVRARGGRAERRRRRGISATRPRGRSPRTRPGPPRGAAPAPRTRARRSHEEEQPRQEGECARRRLWAPRPWPRRGSGRPAPPPPRPGPRGRQVPARPAPLPGFCLRAPGGSNLARPRPLALSSARRALGGPAPHSAAAARRQ